MLAAEVSVLLRWMGLAQNPTFSAFRHQDSKPGEAARRTICTTTSVASTLVGRPGSTGTATALAAVSP